MLKIRSVLALLLLLLPSVGCALAVAGGSEAQQAVQSGPALREDQPALIFLAPHNNNRYAVGAQVLLHAEARDLGEGIARIEFYDNFDDLIDTVEAPGGGVQESLSAVASWEVPSAQRHFLRARAFRADGTASNIAELSIEGVAVAETVPLLPAVSLLGSGGNAIPPNLATDNAALTPGADSAETSPPTLEATEETVPPPTLEASLNATVTGASALNVRLGPSVNSQIVNSVPQGSTIEIVGRSEDNQWYATPLPDGSYGWVYGQYLQFEGDPVTLPLVSA